MKLYKVYNLVIKKEALLPTHNTREAIKQSGWKPQHCFVSLERFYYPLLNTM